MNSEKKEVIFLNKNILKDFLTRTKGEFYLGIVGSVRCGKSTFIKKFMENKVLPNIDDEFVRNKIIDELPQSAHGKTIMTVEPKFIPSNAVSILIENELEMNVRLVDSVGYIIPSAVGYMTDSGPRMVKTPWFSESISFKDAAEIGTKKVITNHSTLGILMTSDGSFGEFSRAEFAEVEERLVEELRALDKPFVMVMNSTAPASQEVTELRIQLEAKYQVSVVVCNVQDLNDADIDNILREALNEFSIAELEIKFPAWVNSLEESYPLKKDIDALIASATQNYKKIRDVHHIKDHLRESPFFENVNLTNLDPSIGRATIEIELKEELYQAIIDELLDFNLEDKADFLRMLQDYQICRREYARFRDALASVKHTGYGVALPDLSDMTLDNPAVVRHGNRYGVKLKAVASSIHMIRVDVSSTFEPIIGTEEQSKLLLDNLLGNESGVWESEIFGRKLSEVVNDGIKAKLHTMPAKAQSKFRETLEKVVNNQSGGMIAIIL